MTLKDSSESIIPNESSYSVYGERYFKSYSSLDKDAAAYLIHSLIDPNQPGKIVIKSNGIFRQGGGCLYIINNHAVYDCKNGKAYGGCLGRFDGNNFYDTYGNLVFSIITASNNNNNNKINTTNSNADLSSQLVGRWKRDDVQPYYKLYGSTWKPIDVYLGKGIWSFFNDGRYEIQGSGNDDGCGTYSIEGKNTLQMNRNGAVIYGHITIIKNKKMEFNLPSELFEDGNPRTYQFKRK